MIPALRLLRLRIVLVAAVLTVPISIIAYVQVTDVGRAATLLRGERGGVHCLALGYAVLRAIGAREIAVDPKTVADVPAAFAAFAASDCPERADFALLAGRDLSTLRSRYAVATAVDAKINAIADATNLAYDASAVAENAVDALGYALVDALPPLGFAASATDRIEAAKTQAAAESRLAILDLDVSELERRTPSEASAVRKASQRQTASVAAYLSTLLDWERRPAARRPKLIAPLQASFAALDELFAEVTSVLDSDIATNLRQLDVRRQHVIGTAVAVLVLALVIVWLVARNVLRRQQGEIEDFKSAALKEARFVAIFAGSPLPIAITDLSGTVFECNRAYLDLVGAPTVPSGRRQLFAPAEHVADGDVTALFEPLRAKTGASAHARIALSRPDDSPIWCDVTATLVCTPGDDDEYCAVMLEDVTERHRHEERLHHDATHDALTGIANRAYLIAQLERRLEEQRDAPRFALLFIDVDDFKTVNDTLGHNAGDACLRAIADRLRSLRRNGNVVARYGGDEFVVVLSDRLDIDNVDAVATRLRRELAAPIEFGDSVLVVSSSIGVVVDTVAADARSVIAASDQAMYADKGRAASRAAKIGRLSSA